MEKPSWRKIDRNSSKPCPRWGHSCSVIQDEVVFFGGYADSNYMNDLWTYHSIDRTWTEVITTGPRPSHRSNCTLSYHPNSRTLLVFGGGGPNKQRFNSVHTLNWDTKQWTEIKTPENEQSPWERTYHVAELSYPYLVIFGGEGLADLDDLWVFDLTTNKWTEVKMDKDACRPCARRFHSSCLIGHQMFVVAGCHGKYRCLSDVYSLDLSLLHATGKMDGLKWVERKLRGASFLSRWGHSSVVYDGKIYVFAGRFSSDLNDVLVIDVQSNSLRGLKMGGSPGDHPKPRRRHCAGFVGSCMIIFGGFNGEYFNDLHYINVFELTAKPEQQEDYLSRLVGNEDLADCLVVSKDGESVPMHRCLLARHFSSSKQLERFLSKMQTNYSKQQLLTLLESLYRGYGKINTALLDEFQATIPESLNRRWLLNQLLEANPNQRNFLALAHNKNQKTTDWVVCLKRQDFERYMQARRELWFMDGEILVGDSYIPVSRGLLAVGSPYLRAMLSGNFQQQGLAWGESSSVVVEMVLNALLVGVLVVPEDYSLEGWKELAELTDYFCLPALTHACELQLCNRISPCNNEELEVFAEKMGMSNLRMYCASHWLKRGEHQRQGVGLQKLKEIVRLDLAHYTWESKPVGLKKGQLEHQLEQKENNRECSNI